MKSLIFSTILFLLCSFAMVAQYEAFNPAIGFGTNGITETTLPDPHLYASFQSILPDGKIIIAGYTGDDAAATGFFLARYNSDSFLDTTFGTNGYVLHYNDYGHIRTFNILPTGKFLISTALYIIRCNSNGTIDETFGDSGIVFSNYLLNFYKLAIQSDGKIIAAYNTYVSFNHASAHLRRYMPNGELDSSFAPNNQTFGFPYGSNRVDLLVQPDDRIVFSYISQINSIQVIRLSTNGVPEDNMINANGNAGYFLKLQPDGKLIIFNPESQTKRFNSDFSIDNAFGQNGNTNDFDDYYFSLVDFDTDGKILRPIYGVDDTFVGEPYNNITIYRNTANGLIDLSLYGTGHQTLPASTFFFHRPTGFDVIGDSIIISGWNAFDTFNVKIFVAKLSLAEYTLAVTQHENAAFDISPNPVKNQLHLQFRNADFLNEEFQIYDIYGKMILKGIIGSTSAIVNTEGLQSGIYFIKISQNHTVKFIKE